MNWCLIIVQLNNAIASSHLRLKLSNEISIVVIWYDEWTVQMQFSLSSIPIDKNMIMVIKLRTISLNSYIVYSWILVLLANFHPLHTISLFVDTFPNWLSWNSTPSMIFSVDFFESLFSVYSCSFPLRTCFLCRIDFEKLHPFAHFIIIPCSLLVVRMFHSPSFLIDLNFRLWAYTIFFSRVLYFIYGFLYVRCAHTIELLVWFEWMEKINAYKDITLTIDNEYRICYCWSVVNIAHYYSRG